MLPVAAYDGRKFSAWIVGVDRSGKDCVVKGWDKFEDYTGDVDLSPGHHTPKAYFNDGDVKQPMFCHWDEKVSSISATNVQYM